MSRNIRQQKILELIAAREVETQEEIADYLAMNEIFVTQATISRDIKELGLIKVPSMAKKQKYIRQITDSSLSNKINDIFKSSVVSMRTAQNIIVIKTIPGCANATGLMIDKLNDEAILGCVAGEDTVIVVVENDFQARQIVEKLNDILY